MEGDFFCFAEILTYKDNNEGSNEALHAALGTLEFF